jgi:two-component system NarL family sensor kinase
MERQYPLRINIQFPANPVDITNDMEHVLYHVARELLLNVVKHAQTNEADLRLRTVSGKVVLTVADQGAGFDPQHAVSPTSFGLFHLTERLREVGGSLDVASVPGKGTLVTVAVPERQLKAPDQR